MQARALIIESPVSWDDAWLLQERLLADRIADRIPDTILVLQHTPVITLGRRGRDQHLLADTSTLQDQGVALRVASRGGDATWHGPGQVVLYPILKLNPEGAGTRGYLCNLEQTAVRTCGDFGVEAWTREGKAGCWTDAGKIAAIGFKFSRWVSHHGMSFNVNPSLDGFRMIVPCGLAGEPVATLEACVAPQATPPWSEVANALLHHLCDLTGRVVEVRRAEEAALPEAWT